MRACEESKDQRFIDVIEAKQKFVHDTFFLNVLPAERPTDFILNGLLSLGCS